MTPFDEDRLLSTALATIEMEAEAVRALARIFDEKFWHAIRLLISAEGRVITSGMGKAGLIARKVAATLSSTGTPSFFVHPGEAVHGDLGMITSQDVVIAFSHRGQTEEVLRIIPYLKHFQTPLIAVTSNPDSQLAKSADIALLLTVGREACPMNLAPTSSTTAMLALGDTIAVVLLEARGFGPDDYALRHPGGSLGRRLLTRVSDLMHTGEGNPHVHEKVPIRDAILVMTRSKMASTSVVDDDCKLVGFFSDGDLRRYLGSPNPSLEREVGEVMTRNPKVAHPDMMAVKALEILERHRIIELPVVDDEHRPIGMIHLHDITSAGIVL